MKREIYWSRASSGHYEEINMKSHPDLWRLCHEILHHLGAFAPYISAIYADEKKDARELRFYYSEQKNKSSFLTFTRTTWQPLNPEEIAEELRKKLIDQVTEDRAKHDAALKRADKALKSVSA